MKYFDLRNTSPLSGKKFDLMAGETLNLSAEKLFIASHSLTLTQKQVELIKKNETLALTGTPLQYIFKKAYFLGSEFYVDKNVLIPRPETEMLVEEAVKYTMENFKYKAKKMRILDLGTGSGCIAISIYKSFDPRYLLPSTITASDISLSALEIARKNARRHKAVINFIKSDLFKNINQKFDLICANLPYGDPCDSDYKKVADPRLATNGKKEGFELIEKTIHDLPAHLNPNGKAIFEIGYNQEAKIKHAAKKIGLECVVEKDLNNFPRIAVVS